MIASRAFGRVGVHTLIGATVLFFGLPLYWLVLSSVRPIAQLMDLSLIPVGLTAENYYVALTQTEIPRWMVNTAVIALLTTLLGLIISSLAAYAFAQHEFRGRQLLFGVIIASLALPEYVTVIPAFVIARSLGLLNTYWAVVLPLAAHALALFLLRQYFREVPRELIDSARIDGAGEFYIYRRIAVPLIRSGLAAAGLMIFLSSWNAYLLPLIMLRDASMFTMPVGLSTLFDQVLAGPVAIDSRAAVTAGTVLSALPIVIFMLAMQRHFVSGLTRGALK